MTFPQVETAYRHGQDFGIGIDAATGSPMGKVVKGVADSVDHASGGLAEFAITRITSTAELEQSLGGGYFAGGDGANYGDGVSGAVATAGGGHGVAEAHVARSPSRITRRGNDETRFAPNAAVIHGAGAIILAPLAAWIAEAALLQAAHVWSKGPRQDWSASASSLDRVQAPRMHASRPAQLSLQRKNR